MPAEGYVNPLGPDKLDILRAVEKSCAGTEELCRKLKEAGLNADAAEEHNRNTFHLARNLRRVFFPTQP